MAQCKLFPIEKKHLTQPTYIIKINNSATECINKINTLGLTIAE